MPYSPNMPCLTMLDFKDKWFKPFSVFRSHDFGRKAYGNIICFSCSAQLDYPKEIKTLIKKLEGV